MQPSVTAPDAGPGRIRTLERGDIPQLVVLSQQAFQRRERVGTDAMTAYFERIFFQNPWVDADLPSLVYEDKTGRVGGFVGVVPRRMLFRGEPIRVAVTTHQAAPDLPTVPGGDHQLSPHGHTHRLAPEQHATRHYPNEPAHPRRMLFRGEPIRVAVTT